ncbi:hypothetical protein [Clostridium perfringens]|uniref:hypothetical protein n=1 Tax=Clostridium perfringens TaxID=1502 RepID=UPI0024BCAE1A|nr:hypothetical protein [Clostridium perfringens]
MSLLKKMFKLSNKLIDEALTSQPEKDDFFNKEFEKSFKESKNRINKIRKSIQDTKQ